MDMDCDKCTLTVCVYGNPSAHPPSEMPELMPAAWLFVLKSLG